MTTAASTAADDPRERFWKRNLIGSLAAFAVSFGASVSLAIWGREPPSTERIAGGSGA